MREYAEGQLTLKSIEKAKWKPLPLLLTFIQNERDWVTFY